MSKAPSLHSETPKAQSILGIQARTSYTFVKRAINSGSGNNASPCASSSVSAAFQSQQKVDMCQQVGTQGPHRATVISFWHITLA
jgi:hypothetical protein